MMAAEAPITAKKEEYSGGVEVSELILYFGRIKIDKADRHTKKRPGSSSKLPHHKCQTKFYCHVIVVVYYVLFAHAQ